MNWINQDAGDESTQIGWIWGNVVINNHPSLNTTNSLGASKLEMAQADVLEWFKENSMWTIFSEAYPLSKLIEQKLERIELCSGNEFIAFFLYTFIPKMFSFETQKHRWRVKIKMSLEKGYLGYESCYHSTPYPPGWEADHLITQGIANSNNTQYDRLEAYHIWKMKRLFKNKDLDSIGSWLESLQILQAGTED